MIDKNIFKKILELEKLYPVSEFDVEKYTKEYISMLENILGHKLLINLPNTKYYDKDILERDILKCLTVEDLRFIANIVI